MIHKVRVGVFIQFEVDDQGDERLLPYLINGNVREAVENNLPEGMAMKVVVTEVDGKKIENVYG